MGVEYAEAFHYLPMMRPPELRAAAELVAEERRGTSMRVLVIGGGAREHALCWAISRSPLLTTLYCAPGNGGTAALAENVALDLTNSGRLRGLGAASTRLT